MTRDEVVAGLAALLSDLSREGTIPAPPVAVDAETVLDDLGLDSIGKLTVIQACESRFSVDIPLGALEGLSSVGDIASLVAGLRS
jgi:acyl carrier protein